MLTVKGKLSEFMKERMKELLHSFDEAIGDYANNGNCHEYVNRINRILYLVQTYARIFDLAEMESSSKMFAESFASLYRDGDVSSGEVLYLSYEARTCLFDMTEMATREGINNLSLFSKRTSAIARAIGKLKKVPHVTAAVGPIRIERQLVA